jgi:tetratricopeptide (TPR) repeat protein
MPDYTDNFDNIISESGLSQSAVMGMADIGILSRFNLFKFYTSRENNASAALVVRNLGPPVLDEPLPTVMNAAISYKPIRPLTLAFDFNLPFNLVDIELSEQPYMAFGISANVTNFLVMRGGVMYKAGSSRVTVGSAVNLNNISLDINYTLDLLTQLQPLNRISLGVRFDLGDGGRQQKANKVDELYFLGLEAYSRGNLEDARYCWEEALRLDPKYDPARQSLAMLVNREDLIQRIDELFRLD